MEIFGTKSDKNIKFSHKLHELKIEIQRILIYSNYFPEREKYYSIGQRPMDGFTPHRPATVLRSFCRGEKVGRRITGRLPCVISFLPYRQMTIDTRD